MKVKIENPEVQFAVLAYRRGLTSKSRLKAVISENRRDLNEKEIEELEKIIEEKGYQLCEAIDKMFEDLTVDENSLLLLPAVFARVVHKELSEYLIGKVVDSLH